MYITLYYAAAFQLQYILYFNRTINLSHNIGLLTGNIALNYTISSDYDFSRAYNATVKGTINTKIRVTGYISSQRSACTDKAGGIPIGIERELGFGFSVEHSIRF